MRRVGGERWATFNPRFLFLCFCSLFIVLCSVVRVFCLFCGFVFVFCFALYEGRWRGKMGDFQPRIFVLCFCACVLFSLFCVVYFCFCLWFCFVFMFCVLCFALNEGRWRRKMGDFPPQIFVFVFVFVFFFHCSLFRVLCCVFFLWFCFVFLFCVFGVLHSMREVGGEKWATFNPRVVSYTFVFVLFFLCSVFSAVYFFVVLFCVCVLCFALNEGRWRGKMGDFQPQTTPFLGWPMPPTAAVKGTNFL